MRYILWLATLIGLGCVTVFAQQNDPVALLVNGRPIHKSEFEISYKKNNELTDNSKESFDKFLQSYIDYQLAVEEAYSQGLDTASNFRYQVSTFRSGIAVPYMQEGGDLIEAYIDRLKKYKEQDVEINHVLIPFGKDQVLPADTLVAYKKAMDVYARLKKDGFVGDLSKDNTGYLSVVRDRSQLDGYLGWVTPSMLPAKIVNAIYSLPLQELSKPIRTIKGYHIVQVLARRQAVGKLKVDHIYFAFPQIPATPNQIDSVMLAAKSLLATPGANFDDLCIAYTEAYGLKDKGCTLEAFGLDGQLPVSLITAAYKIKNVGDLSELVVTELGVHLMRLAAKLPLPDSNRQLKEVKELMSTKDWWCYQSNENQKRLFKKYNLRLETAAYDKIKAIANNYQPTDSLFVRHISNREDVLFVIDDSVKISVGRFADYLNGQVKTEKKESYEQAMSKFFGSKTEDPFNLSVEQLDWLFAQFAIRILQTYVFDTLEKRYPEMSSRITEFAGGLLAYEVKDRNIYRTIGRDREGLQQLFQKNRKKYVWDNPRFKGYVIRCSDEKSYKLVKKIADSVKEDVNLITLIKKEFERSSLPMPEMEKGIWSEGDDPAVDGACFKKKDSETEAFVLLKGKLLKAPQEYTDAGGDLVADYQDFKEMEWFGDLRGKYKVVVNKEVLETVR